MDFIFSKLKEKRKQKYSQSRFKLYTVFHRLEDHGLLNDKIR